MVEESSNKEIGSLIEHLKLCIPSTQKMKKELEQKHHTPEKEFYQQNHLSGFPLSGYILLTK